MYVCVSRGLPSREARTAGQIMTTICTDMLTDLGIMCEKVTISIYTNLTIGSGLPMRYGRSRVNQLATIISCRKVVKCMELVYTQSAHGFPDDTERHDWEHV